MREIKFRAKTTVKDEDVAFNNVWVEGDLIFSRRKPYIHPKAKSVNVKGELGKIIVMHEVQEETVCQYTGLKDKNGKEIWENDIVCFQFDNDNCTLPYTDTKKRYGKIFFSNHRASFAIAMGRNGSKSMNNDLYKYVQCGNRVEVIGNIFDNPELLERGAE